jgi:hypothetical protein
MDGESGVRLVRFVQARRGSLPSDLRRMGELVSETEASKGALMHAIEGA